MTQKDENGSDSAFKRMADLIVLAAAVAVFAFVVHLRSPANTDLASVAITLSLAAASALVVVLLAKLAIGRPLMPWKTDDASGPDKNAATVEKLEAIARNHLTFILVGGGIFIILVTSIAVTIAISNEVADDNVLIGMFNSIITLIAAWVGSVIAFYFASDNFRTASIEARQNFGGAGATGPDVTTLMTPFKNMPRVMIERNASGEEVVSTAKIHDEFKRETVSTVFVFDTGRSVKRAIEDKAKFVAKYKEPSASIKVADLSKDDFVIGSKSSDFAFSARFFSIPNARDLMNKKSDCNHVFVTETGGSGEAVLGWVAREDFGPVT